MPTDEDAPGEAHQSQLRRRTQADPELVVVANRGPLRRKRSTWQRSAGGLVTALDPVLRAQGGYWISADQVPETAVPEGLGYALRHVDLPPNVECGYYEKYANGLLWPVLHGFAPALSPADAPYEDYAAANRAFALAAMRDTGPAPTFWIHDYHLMLSPQLIRAARPDARIGWFCHVPWPAPEQFAILPSRSQLLEGLLAADVLGFHCERYAEKFLACVEQLTQAKVDRVHRRIHVGKHACQLRVAPIGIAHDSVASVLGSRTTRNTREALKADVGWRSIVLGVDRLDYTKGIPERLRAFERLLENDPGLIHRVVLVQLVVPSREKVASYDSLRDEIERLVGHINGRFGQPGCMPVHYLYRSLPPRTLYGYYSAADIALVTPLRDGMNLVAQEYVAAHPQGDGALILSEFAGAADYLKAAHLVNPYDVDGVAEALRRVLGSDPNVLARRMRTLQEQVRAMDVHAWAKGFLEALNNGDRHSARIKQVLPLARRPRKNEAVGMN